MQKKRVHVRRGETVHARVVARLLACTPDDLSRLIHRALNVATKRAPIDVVFIPPRAFVISFDKASLRGADDSSREWLTRVERRENEKREGEKRITQRERERERKRGRERDLQVFTISRIYIYIYNPTVSR